MEENIINNENVLPDAGHTGVGWEQRLSSLLGKDKRKRLLKRTKPLLLVLAFVLVWVLVIQYIAADKYQARVKVVAEGTSASNEISAAGLDFGTMPKGNTSTRFVTIENGSGHDIYVRVIKLGDIGKFIQLNRSSFVLKSKESENLEFSLSIPKNVEDKGYSGRILVFEIPKIF